MILNTFRTNIILLLPFVCLLESPAFSSQESTSNQQSKKTILLSQNNLQTSTSSTGVVRRGRVPVRKTGSIKPQYESCKGKNIYKLNSEFQDTSSEAETEATGPCIDCAVANADSLDGITQTLQETRKGAKIRTRGGVRTVTEGVNESGNSGKKKSPYQSFKDQLRAKVLGQVKIKMAQTQILQKCTEEGNIEKHRGWLTKRFPKVDWPPQQHQ